MKNIVKLIDFHKVKGINNLKLGTLGEGKKIILLDPKSIIFNEIYNNLTNVNDESLVARSSDTRSTL